MWGARTIDDLERLEILDPKSVADWKRALDFLWRLRFGLHLVEGRRHDRLGFSQQETLARTMGYLEKNPESGLEDFMHDYYRHAYYIHRATERLIGFYLKRSPLRRMKDHFFSRRLDRYISRKGDSIYIDPEAVRSDPGIVFKGWKIAHRLKLPLTTETKGAIRLASETWTDISIVPEIADTFREILKDPVGLDKLLLELHETGVLFKLIPEFENLHHKVKLDAYHLYTVDIHTIFLIRELSELFSGENKKRFPHFFKTARRMERPDLLTIACLLHDIGKGYEREERHDTFGAVIAKEIAGRLGFNEEDQEAVDFLVRYHLVLPQLAFCRDIDDSLMIENLANSVKTTDDLRRLYLLTFADIRATGPDVWSSWKGELLTKLYQKTRKLLAGRGDTARNIEEALNKKKKSMKKLILEDDHDQAIEWIHGMPNRYVLNTSSEELVGHYLAHMETEGDDRPLKLLVKPFEAYHELTIVTKDHPGLFAHLCSVFFRNKINILEAQLYTGKNRNVVDIFRVVSSLGSTIENDFDWARLEVDMKQEASKEPQQYLRSDTSTDGIRRRRMPIERSVQIDNDVSVDHTVLEIHSKDQIGLLYHLAEWLYQHHYDISMAKAITHAGNVIDIFYIRTIDGKKVESKEELIKMKEGLVDCLKE